MFNIITFKSIIILNFSKFFFFLRNNLRFFIKQKKLFIGFSNIKNCNNSFFHIY